MSTTPNDSHAAQLQHLRDAIRHIDSAYPGKSESDLDAVNNHAFVHDLDYAKSMVRSAIQRREQRLCDAVEAGEGAGHQ